MNKEDLKIVYMGTPDFAVESLRCLVEGGYNVVGVITMPDKPVGRHGSVLQASPVKQYAVEHGIKVLQPEKLKNPEFVEELRSLQADLQIVVAFRMLPEVVWNMPRLGTFNLHASLLPQYRGAAPINWAVINGDTETGITTFFLRHEIDTGDIIQQVCVPISDSDNVGDVHDRLMLLGGKLVTETVDNILAGTIKPIPQDKLIQAGDAELRPAPKIFHETCEINWNQPTKKIYDFIRGLSPYPAAWTTLNGVQMKIFESEKVMPSELQSQCAGSIITDGKTYVNVVTADGLLSLKTVQLAGKKRMPIQDFLRGFHFTDNASFGLE
ncbi:MAG: methionyl-tRNA formyltransferase [Prevotellaceae bacterium]|nr:methionyl-tRNA formyltransferase [Candidatus Colivivens equi]